MRASADGIACWTSVALKWLEEGLLLFIRMGRTIVNHGHDLNLPDNSYLAGFV
ncbi:MAG: hypothetical protein KC422_25985 [Trueperaceae bacterium]|nr:hypothetical protein [Trueperaceae bacterium]